MSSAFFAHRPPAEPGLAIFLNAGDPPLPVLRDVVSMLDETGVDCLELAVPFPNSVTDGPVIRRSARRALDRGVNLAGTLAFVRDVRPGLRHLRIALLADWSHTVKPAPLDRFMARVRDSGADALLLHALPPRLRTGYHRAAERLGLPIVTTCYVSSRPEVRAEACRFASAYLYLVAHYGRSGTTPGGGYSELRTVLAELRRRTEAPVAVGFGVRGRADVGRLHEAGADAVIVGSAAVARVEDALAAGQNVAETLRAFIEGLRPLETREASHDHPSPVRS